MAAYATAERPAQSAGFRLVPTEIAQALTAPVGGGTGFEVLLNQLVELVAERVAERLKAPGVAGDEWLDSRAAAEHLGVHRDTIRRLAAERAIPSEQDRPGCKLFFRRTDLDTWRCATARPLHAVAGAGR